MDEDTPLLRDSGGISASPRNSLELSSYPRAGNSRGSDTSRRSHQTTELELNVDKISILFSPTARKGFDTPHNYKNFAEVALDGSAQSTDELNMLDPYFDVTPPRLRIAFEGARPEKDGNLCYEGFRAALETLGIKCSDDIVFAKLVHNIDTEKNGGITLQQFDAAVHRLKMMHMFDEGTVQEMKLNGYQQAGLSISDFSGTKLQTFALRQKNLHEFYTTPRPEWVNVRWINLDGRDSLNLKRLAIKYRLHPLAIEDTIEGHERPKFDRYDEHLFLVFPVLRMKVIPDKGLPLDRKRARLYSDTRKTSLPTFVKRKSFHTSISTITDELEEKDEDPFQLWIEHVFIFVVDNDTVITVKDGGGSDIWTELNRRLAVPYSKLRHNDANFLVYSVLDVIVDQFTSVVDSVTECLIALENQLEVERHRFEMRSLRVLKNELFRLPRLLKPAREVLKNIIESKDFDATVTDYVRDVHDHVVAVLDDIEQQVQMCRQLTEEYRDAKATQMNYVIYTLTVVTTVFLPGQFLTGVYGMNFDVMPELHERYGYALFWVFAIAIAAALQLYFRHKQWI
ncbi:magnesium and cobalt transporter [Plasmopara halstedii]|uniref:Magnesium and cobalt transporter n=1 Tax=Plasmopara halstedii TaxID=4781 RepID=A0A0P1B1D4_PLAHL|nr:magnesium and cobalt transporter [Plasmopara halstedii]CEG47607.1 magnesium and cobalt transporter [Plasmopara halstedii]|eukprot:XP_024583976.1 magnesium and cobalt transporter [Plasmopara halstedii]